MKLLFRLVAAFSIAVIPPTVKVYAAEKLKANLTKSDIDRLTDVLIKIGHDITIGEHLAPVIGLPGPRLGKSQSVRNRVRGKDRDALNVVMVFEETTDETRKPSCIYLMKKTVSSRNDDALYFRINLEGQLERAILSAGTLDENGKIIRGSGKATDKDISSPEIRQTYEAETLELRAWLKKQTSLTKTGKQPAKSQKKGE